MIEKKRKKKGKLKKRVRKRLKNKNIKDVVDLQSFNKISQD